MTRIPMLSILLPTILMQSVPAQVGGPASRGHLTPGTVAITNVGVISMLTDTMMADATVLIRDGRIVAVGPSSRVTVPRGARTINAAGKYLIPGLADMHTHLYSDAALPDSIAPAELGVMLANGVTAARLMAGTPEQLHLRTAVQRGTVLGPQLWLASPMFAASPGDNTRVVTSPAEGRTAVTDVARSGYDFVKITFGITGAVYDAIVAEAKVRGIGVVGHVEPVLGLQRAIAAGQQLEHLDAYLEAALADSAPMKESLTQYGIYRPQNWASLDHLDGRKLTALAQLTARSRVWVGPTLEVFNRAFSIPLSDDSLRALPDWPLIPASVRTPYLASRNRYWAQNVSREQRARFAAVRNTIVRTIAEAGGADRLLAGSDTPDLLMVYGFALHRELEAMVAAGLTPLQALATATRNPAAYLGAGDEWGTVAPGRRADLVLLDANPLADIRNTRRIDAVVIGGRVIDRSQLAAMIEAGTAAVNRP